MTNDHLCLADLSCRVSSRLEDLGPEDYDVPFTRRWWANIKALRAAKGSIAMPCSIVRSRLMYSARAANVHKRMIFAALAHRNEPKLLVHRLVGLFIYLIDLTFAENDM